MLVEMSPGASRGRGCWPVDVGIASNACSASSGGSVTDDTLESTATALALQRRTQPSPNTTSRGL